MLEALRPQTNKSISRYRGEVLKECGICSLRSWTRDTSVAELWGPETDLRPTSLSFSSSFLTCKVRRITMATPIFLGGYMLVGKMLWKHILTAILLS